MTQNYTTPAATLAWEAARTRLLAAGRTLAYFVEEARAHNLGLDDVGIVSALEAHKRAVRAEAEAYDAMLGIPKILAAVQEEIEGRP